VTVRCKSLRWCVLILCVGLSVACTSNLVLGTMYNQFGTRSAKQFKSFATFTSSQKNLIDGLAAGYHSWHRSTQLPRYATFLRQIVADIETSQPLAIENSSLWWQNAGAFMDDMRSCNPLNVSADLLAGLSDKQVLQVAARMRDQQTLREDEYSAESADEKIQRRFERIRKWASRSGAGFNSQQDLLLRQTLSDQISLGEQRHELRRAWMEEFIALLNQRHEPEFKNKVTEHIDASWQLTATAFPQQWRDNETLWIAFIADYINLQTDKQREKFIKTALSTAASLDTLSKKVVEAAPVCHTP